MATIIRDVATYMNRCFNANKKALPSTYLLITEIHTY